MASQRPRIPCPRAAILLLLIPILISPTSAKTAAKATKSTPAPASKISTTNSTAAPSPKSVAKAPAAPAAAAASAYPDFDPEGNLCGLTAIGHPTNPAALSTFSLKCSGTGSILVGGSAALLRPFIAGMDGKIVKWDPAGCSLSGSIIQSNQGTNEDPTAADTRSSSGAAGSAVVICLPPNNSTTFTDVSIQLKAFVPSGDMVSIVTLMRGATVAPTVSYRRAALGIYANGASRITIMNGTLAGNRDSNDLVHGLAANLTGTSKAWLYNLEVKENSGTGMFLTTGNTAQVEINNTIYYNNGAETMLGRRGGMAVEMSDRSAVTVKAARFYRNTAPGASGGGFFGTLANSSVLALEGGQFEDNTAAAAGGMSVEGQQEATISLKVVSFLSNLGQTGAGGGLAAKLSDSAKLQMSTMNFTRNFGSGGGGLDVMATDTATVTFANSSVTLNDAKDGIGGGMRLALAQNATAALTGLGVKSNAAQGGGGAYAEVDVDSTLSVSNSAFTTNAAVNMGGGMDIMALTVPTGVNNTPVTDANVTLTNVDFNANEAYVNGGLSLSGQAAQSYVTLTNVGLTDNKANFGGMSMVPVRDMKGVRFEGNSVASGLVSAPYPLDNCTKCVVVTGKDGCAIVQVDPNLFDLVHEVDSPRPCSLTLTNRTYYGTLRLYENTTRNTPLDLNLNTSRINVPINRKAICRNHPSNFRIVNGSGTTFNRVGLCNTKVGYRRIVVAFMVVVLALGIAFNLLRLLSNVHQRAKDAKENVQCCVLFINEKKTSLCAALWSWRHIVITLFDTITDFYVISHFWHTKWAKALLGLAMFPHVFSATYAYIALCGNIEWRYHDEFICCLLLLLLLLMGPMVGMLVFYIPLCLIAHKLCVGLQLVRYSMPAKKSPSSKDVDSPVSADLTCCYPQLDIFRNLQSKFYEWMWSSLMALVTSPASFIMLSIAYVNSKPYTGPWVSNAVYLTSGIASLLHILIVVAHGVSKVMKRFDEDGKRDPGNLFNRLGGRLSLKGSFSNSAGRSYQGSFDDRIPPPQNQGSFHEGVRQYTIHPIPPAPRPAPAPAPGPASGTGGYPRAPPPQMAPQMSGNASGKLPPGIVQEPSLPRVNTGAQQQRARDVTPSRSNTLGSMPSIGSVPSLPHPQGVSKQRSGPPPNMQIPPQDHRNQRDQREFTPPRDSGHMPQMSPFMQGGGPLSGGLGQLPHRGSAPMAQGPAPGSLRNSAPPGFFQGGQRDGGLVRVQQGPQPQYIRNSEAQFQAALRQSQRQQQQGSAPQYSE